MSSRFLNFSLGLNLVLLGVAGYWAVRHHSNDGALPTTAPIFQTNRVIEEKTEMAAADPKAPTDLTPLHWNEIESDDYATYVANLRKAGCPEPIVRRIITAELKELYAQKGFALAREFHRDFWEIAARENVREYFAKKLGPQVKDLGKESDALLKQLIGEAANEVASATTAGASESGLMDFLSPAKREQLRQLTEGYEARMQAIRQANLSSAEKESQIAELRRDMEREQAQILSLEEFTEYQLRQSSAAGEVQQLYGVNFSETEMRNLAKAIDDYHRRADKQDETDPETLDQKLQAVLGAERFADLNRARSASYREIYEVASDFGEPSQTAAELFDLRLKSEKQSDDIRADKNRSTEEKRALLDDLEEQVDQAFLAKFGAGAYQSYKAKDGRWINALGRL